MADVLTPEEKALLESANLPSGGETYGALTPEMLQDIGQEQALSKEFDMPTTAAALAAARGASLGLSDVVLTGSGLVAPETLRNIEEQNPWASGTAEVGGAIAPAFISGGATVPAKAAMKGATALGEIAAKKATTAAGKKIIGTAAAGAAEGAAFGAGTLVSDIALENQKLSAESIIGTVGPGIMIGGVGGSLLGAGSVALTGVGKVAKPVSKRVVSFAEGYIDPVRAAEKLSGLAPKRLIKLNEGRAAGQTFSDDALEYMRRNLVSDIGSMPDDLVAANSSTISKVGKQIDELTSRLDDEVIMHPDIYAESNVRSRLDAVLNKWQDKLSRMSGVKAPQLRALKNFRHDVAVNVGTGAEAELEAAAAKAGLGAPAPGQGIFGRLNQLRKDLQDISHVSGRSKLENIPSKIADDLRREIRTITDEVSDRIGARVGGEVADIGNRLRQVNKDYHIGMELKPGLAVRAQKRDDLGLWEIIKGGDIRRNILVLNKVGEKVGGVKQAIKSAVGNFFQKTKRPALSLTNKSLIDSGFALSEDRKQAKNEKAAFKNIQAQLSNLSNPDFLVERIAKVAAPAFNISPQMGMAAQNQLITAVEFLHNKLPKHIGSGPAQLLFPKEYEPTDMERAQFQRYAQIVEQPLTILEELEAGTMTREHVEALKYVYPEIYKQVQLSVYETIASNPDVSYQKKVQLGILLDIPSDESLTGESVLGLQNNFAPAQAQTMGGAEATNPSVQSAQAANMDELKLANRAGSGVETLSNRRI